MQADSLLNRIAAGARASELESDVLEIKQEARSLKESLELVADAVVCLANAHGGRIVVGVLDDVAGPGALVGVGDSLTCDTVVRGIFDRTVPSLSVPVEEIERKGNRFIVITVPRGATLYANSRGTSTRRVGAACRPFPPEEQRQAMAARGMHDWSALPTGATVDDLDPAEIARLRALLQAAGRPEMAELDTGRILADLRLLDSNGQLTRAALLLLGKGGAIRTHVPQYEYAYQYRPAEGAEAEAHIRENRPVLAGIERLLDLVAARQRTRPLGIRGGVQLQLEDYPSRAVRELVVNAFVHRDYAVAASVDVLHTPHELRVSSPGGLVFGVTPVNILSHPSTPRNQLLMETIAVLRVAERTGQGIDRVYREMLRAGKPPPTFEDLTTRVHARLAGGAGHDAFVRYVTAELGDPAGSDLDVLLTLAHLRHHRSIDAPTLAELIQRPADTAQASLARMFEGGLIEPTKRTTRRQHPNYGLTPATLAGLSAAVSYHRRSGTALDEKVVAHVLEYGFVTSPTLQRMFDVGVFPARDLLRDLQGRGILTKLDQRAGGRGIRYGPGDNFPTRRGREGDGSSSVDGPDGS
jgi:ATP-dependent DNA helicase RecG